MWLTVQVFFSVVLAQKSTSLSTTHCFWKSSGLALRFSSLGWNCTCGGGRSRTFKLGGEKINHQGFAGKQRFEPRFISMIWRFQKKSIVNFESNQTAKILKKLLCSCCSKGQKKPRRCLWKGVTPKRQQIKLALQAAPQKKNWKSVLGFGLCIFDTHTFVNSIFTHTASGRNIPTMRQCSFGCWANILPCWCHSGLSSVGVRTAAGGENVQKTWPARKEWKRFLLAN